MTLIQTTKIYAQHIVNNSISLHLERVEKKCYFIPYNIDITSNIITPPKKTNVLIVMQTAPNLRVHASNKLHALKNCIMKIIPYLIIMYFLTQ